MLPQAVRRWVRRYRSGPTYRGDFASWADAQRVSRGYADPAILDKAVAATRAVRDGRAAWERDTILFHEPMANGPLLRSLRRATEAAGGVLDLADFGGALGSAWWQHRAWLADVKDARWSVIEQEGFVAAGRREFTVGPLRFHGSLDECFASSRPSVLLLSSVLPYLENPRALLADVRGRAFRHVIIDRTGFVVRGRDRLTVQQVPAAIYEATYPCWFFDRTSLLAEFTAGWTVVDEWPTADEADIDARHGGLMLERNVT